MNDCLSAEFLRTRIWATVLVILLGLGTAAGLFYPMLRAQAAESQFAIAFSRMVGAVSEIERTAAMMSARGGWEPEMRARFRIAVGDLASLYLAVCSGAPVPPADGAGCLPDAGRDGGIDRLASAAGFESADRLRGLRLREGRFSRSMLREWNDGNRGAPLARSTGRFLLLAAALMEADPAGKGGAASSNPIAAEIVALARTEVYPALRRVEATPEDAIAGAYALATWSILGVAGAGVLALFVTLGTILLPLARQVRARHAALAEARDRAAAEAVSKQNLLAVVSHELRTPMSGILGFASLLLRSNLKPEHRKQVEIIESSGRTLLALVNDILDLSRIEAGALILAQDSVSIESVIAEVTTLLHGNAAAKGLETAIYVDPRLPPVLRGDTGRLRQVLVNLVGNAIKFTDAGGIAVEAHAVPASADAPDSCALELVVADTGIGIPGDLQEAIFDRFIQVGAGARRRSDGTGLGLAICRELVARMGGSIRVESQPGAGSTFIVRLPVVAADRSSAGPDGSVPPLRALAARLAGTAVLLIDGCSLSRRTLRMQLEALGVHVDEAATPDQCAGLLDRGAAGGKHHAAVVVSDTASPAEASDLIRALGTDPRLSGLPVVMASAAGDLGGHGASKRPQVASIAKPVLPRALAEALCDLIGEAGRLPGSGTPGAPTGDATVVQIDGHRHPGDTHPAGPSRPAPAPPAPGIRQGRADSRAVRLTR